MEFNWHQPDMVDLDDDLDFKARWAPYEDSEFYPHGPLVTIVHDGRRITIDREGESHLRHGDTDVRSPQEFRAAFPDGQIPEDSDWHVNGWFDLYTEPDAPWGENGHLDAVTYELTDAINDAKDRLLQWSHDAKQLRSTGDFGPGT